MSRPAQQALGLGDRPVPRAGRSRLRRLLHDNGLSLAFWALFVAALAGTIVAGFALQHEHRSGLAPAAGLAAYAVSPDLLRSVLVNWQAAVLQLLVLIVFARMLRQRGASHSRQPDSPTARAAAPAGRQRSWLYRHSFSLAFAALFVVTLTGYVFADWPAYNDERARLGEAALGLGAYCRSARLWFNLFETWEAEFFAMGSFLVLSIVLREEGSAESKPVDAPDGQTGGVNE